MVHSKVGTVKANPKYNLHVTTPSPIPKSPFHALRDPNWKQAMCDEYKALIDNNTWVLVPRPPNVNIVCSMWLYKHKYNADGSLSRSRFMASSRPTELGFSDFPAMLFEPVSITAKPTRLFSSFTKGQTQLTYYYMWMISFLQLLHFTHATYHLSLHAVPPVMLKANEPQLMILKEPAMSDNLHPAMVENTVYSKPNRSMSRENHRLDWPYRKWMLVRNWRYRVWISWSLMQRYPFELVDFDSIEPKNKYIIGELLMPLCVHAGTRCGPLDIDTVVVVLVVEQQTPCYILRQISDDAASLLPKIDPTEGVEESMGSSTLDVDAGSHTPKLKRMDQDLYVHTPLKPSEEGIKIRVDADSEARGDTREADSKGKAARDSEKGRNKRIQMWKKSMVQLKGVAKTRLASIRIRINGRGALAFLCSLHTYIGSYTDVFLVVSYAFRYSFSLEVEDSAVEESHGSAQGSSKDNVGIHSDKKKRKRSSHKASSPKKNQWRIPKSTTGLKDLASGSTEDGNNHLRSKRRMSNTESEKASMLDEVIEYLNTLKMQVQPSKLHSTQCDIILCGELSSMDIGATPNRDSLDRECIDSQIPLVQLSAVVHNFSAGDY
ncbi:ribonuclease H-like domain-containing protein [Tanacetum coccineum]